MQAHVQKTAERGKDFARSRGVGKCSRRKEGGVEGFPGSPSHPHTLPGSQQRGRQWGNSPSSCTSGYGLKSSSSHRFSRKTFDLNPQKLSCWRAMTRVCHPGLFSAKSAGLETKVWQISDSLQHIAALRQFGRRTYLGY